ALLVPLLPGRRPYQLIYILFTMTFLLNLLWVDSGTPFTAFNNNFMQNIPVALPIAALNLFLLIYYAISGIRDTPNIANAYLVE
ncbi:MAG: hypothetical protein WAM60_11505, partial [Candidatus Promineifilaceae bacterium]